MSADYTPTTSEVRSRYRKWRAAHGVGGTGAEFDRWLAAHDAEVTEALRLPGEGHGDWTLDQWEEWSNEVASSMPESWDGDEAQEDIIARFAKFAAEHLATCDTETEALRAEAAELERSRDVWVEETRRALSRAEAAEARLAAVEALAGWHETKADKARRFPGAGNEAIMAKAARVHDESAAKIRDALSDEAGAR